MKNEKTLEILVVEDNPLHQEAAKVLLNEYNITVVGTFDEAIDALNQCSKENRIYDVVLTDMFFPQGRGEMQRDKSSAKDPQDFGLYLAMAAAIKGVPYIAIVSDTDHHSDGRTYAFQDQIMKGNNERPVKIGENSLLFSPFNWMYKSPNGDIISYEKAEEQGIKYEQLIGVKDWKYALDTILKNQVHI